MLSKSLSMSTRGSFCNLQVSRLNEVVSSAEAANTKAFEAITALQTEVESGEKLCDSRQPSFIG